MKSLAKILCPVLILVGVCIVAQAQSPVYHPGDVIRLSVTFVGPDADKIENIAFSGELGKQPEPSQAGFQNSFFCDMSKSKKTATNTFECSFTIPQTQANGEYSISGIRGYAHVGDQIQLFWDSSTDFPKKTLRIENPKKFLKPSIKDVTIP